MNILDVEQERANYKTKLAAYNKIRNTNPTERTPLMRNGQGEAAPINDPEPASTESPEQIIYREYQELTTMTKQLDRESNEDSGTPCDFVKKNKINYHRDRVLKAAERLKTALLQDLLLKMLAEFDIDRNTIEIFKKENAISLWKKIATYFIWGTTLLYGCFKGYSALAGVLSAFVASHHLAVILPSAISAGIFCLMLFAFEGQEVCNSQGLTGNQRSTRAQIGQQYEVAATMATCISQLATTEAGKENPDNDKIAKLEKYNTILTDINRIDLTPKIKIATDYANKANTSKVRKVGEKVTGGFLSVLNGASFGFVGISTVALIAKCSVAVLLSAAMLSTPAGIAALVSFGLLFIAGCAVGWLVKNLGSNLVKALDKKSVFMDIAKKEKETPFASKLTANAGFFTMRHTIKQQDEEITTLKAALGKRAA